MPKAGKFRKFAAVKKIISPNDARLKVNQEKEAAKQKKKEEEEAQKKHVSHAPTSMFLTHNTALAPPYRVLVDTNFLNLSLTNRIDLVRGMLDCLYAKAIPCVSDCVIAELEKLGSRYRLALNLARDPRVERLPCAHRGTYADDCIVHRVTAHRCYIVATCDRGLRRRLRKIPGVPLMFIKRKQFAIERLPDSGLPS
ncbi:hypothetical protein O181_081417 [Austropuccinia psidii MF-1]|uniref:PIN domain-containing protein n=1 Tax=Austropuccinia psidii MF-1 TaxID=1389203 RepID=A0A9Q3FNK6_9BASI|nr:hypothetical protein [Austropuccinia psidii MF-1]